MKRATVVLAAAATYAALVLLTRLMHWDPSTGTLVVLMAVSGLVVVWDVTRRRRPRSRRAQDDRRDRDSRS